MGGSAAGAELRLGRFPVRSLAGPGATAGLHLGAGENHQHLCAAHSSSVQANQHRHLHREVGLQLASLRSELKQRLRQLERVQVRLQKLQTRICVPFAQVEEGTERYARVVEVSEKLKDLQSVLTKSEGETGRARRNCRRDCWESMS